MWNDFLQCTTIWEKQSPNIVAYLLESLSLERRSGSHKSILATVDGSDYVSLPFPKVIITETEVFRQPFYHHDESTNQIACRIVTTGTTKPDYLPYPSFLQGCPEGIGDGPDN
ncbi:hypothetical protein RRG08_004382 [Elysia crispata]|uniref:Uncharacterized protein n=1 Tax=Elysia crispata TaxID=231223 RepID=A0AAE0Z707_9GAST|nr:hypothetical protein RRG08_004382 [Elysia crispata]